VHSPVFNRQTNYSEVIQKNRIEDLLDEMMNDKEQDELIKAEECCRKFLLWNLKDECNSGSLAVRERLDSVLGRNENQDLE